MGFNPPVPQQDSNWEIRVGVLLSLVFQVVLIFAGPLRKRSTPACTRFVIWSCYLLADWVADLALGLLLNNMGNIGGGGGGSVGDLAHRANAASLKRVPAGGGGGGGGSPIIFAFWAPFLLLHLGGPDTITAYSLADNELWHRHLIGLLFELSAAAVVFFCSLRGNKMVTATVLMFVAGVIKYGERTYSLYSGSSGGFRDIILGEPDAESTKVFTRLMREFSHRTRSGLPADLVFTNPHQEISTSDMHGAPEEIRAYELFLIFRPLFVNGVVSSTKVKMTKAFFLGLDDSTTAIEILEQEINYAYDMLYTKMPALRTMAGHILRFVGCCCVISSLVIFALIDKAGLLPADVCITYALLLSAVALDAAALTMLLFSDWTLVFVHESKYSKRLAWLANASRMAKRWWTVRRWSQKVKQMNLLDDIPERTRNGRCFKLTQRVREIFYDFVSTGRAPAVPPDDIMPFIFEVFKDAAKDPERIDKLRDCRGDGILGRLRDVEEMKQKGILILSSVKETDFDESLLMWHVATSLCCVIPTVLTEQTRKKKLISEKLSRYMLIVALDLNINLNP